MRCIKTMQYIQPDIWLTFCNNLCVKHFQSHGGATRDFSTTAELLDQHQTSASIVEVIISLCHQRGQNLVRNPSSLVSSLLSFISCDMKQSRIQDTKLLSISLPNIDQNSFTDTQICNKRSLQISLQRCGPLTRAAA